MADAWGLGWMLKDGDGGTLVCHSGVTIGQRAWLDVLPAHRVRAGAAHQRRRRPALATRLRAALLRDVAGFDCRRCPPIDETLARRARSLSSAPTNAPARTSKWLPCGAGIGVRIRAIWFSMAADPPLLPLRPIGGDRFRVTLPGSADDTIVGFAEAGAPGGARFVEMQGRAHPRAA